jgi:hypothetical protein
MDMSNWRVIQWYLDPQFMEDKFKITSKTELQTVYDYLDSIYKNIQKTYISDNYVIESMDDYLSTVDIEKGLYLIQIDLSDSNCGDDVVNALIMYVKTLEDYLLTKDPTHKKYKFKIKVLSWEEVYPTED